MQGNIQTVHATTASGCAAISCAVASDDTEQLVWCWRKERHNRDDVLVLCHPAPISLLHIADNQPLLYLQVYSHIAVSRCCRGRGQSLRTDQHLVSSYFVANFAYLRPTRLSPSFPLNRHTSAASPASMTSSTVASFLQTSSAFFSTTHWR